ncbi:GNAT family N-acetyltransferase [Nocardioides bruguierae]|uniref:GNAT family N-acetyltransferase n=1 Tax=Nocardioides bruguierae TaxID=2945102 RepID=A0A9X2IH77_9ACTN|nr:GNAT family N-acetyltransferase [Nocardioides bruguierae]MCM0621505.1 GNAT family N-acetyltransferase [Nocardioides bruguierae]
MTESPPPTPQARLEARPEARTAANPFAGLDVHTAYAAWKLRQDVFVVEQRDPYDDLDGRDTEPATRHVTLHVAGDERLLGIARVLDDGAELRIGRVVLHPDARGRGLSAPLMHACLEACEALDAEAGLRRDVVLGAQSPLVGFYGGFGFVVDGEEYLDGHIPHRPMRLARG